MHFAIQPVCPSQKAQQLPARGPYKTKNLSCSQRLSLLAGVSLDAPAQVLAPPRRQPMAACRIPHESNGCQQIVPFHTKYSRPAPRTAPALVSPHKTKAGPFAENKPQSAQNESEEESRSSRIASARPRNHEGWLPQSPHPPLTIPCETVEVN